ncbi:MAG: PilZ domain-containing protein, partial [Clostridiales bacterium]|nr:PilZ domain-containing protein [Clostridiales bacterium]
AKIKDEKDTSAACLTASITILDISAGGMLIETDYSLASDDIITSDFTIQDKTFSEKCRVMRVLKKDAGHRQYGLKFIEMNSSVNEKLIQCILFLQSKNVASIR